MNAIIIDDDDDSAFQADLARAIAASLEPDGAVTELGAGRCSPALLAPEDDDDSYQRQLAAAMAASLQCAEEDNRRRKYGHSDGGNSSFGAGSDGGYAVQAHLQLQPQAAAPHQQQHQQQYQHNKPYTHQQQEQERHRGLHGHMHHQNQLPYPPQVPYQPLPQPQLPPPPPLQPQHMQQPPRAVLRDSGEVCCSGGLLLKPLGQQQQQQQQLGFAATGLPPADSTFGSRDGGSNVCDVGTGGGAAPFPIPAVSPFAVTSAAAAAASPFAQSDAWGRTRPLGISNTTAATHITAPVAAPPMAAPARPIALGAASLSTLVATAAVAEAAAANFAAGPVRYQLEPCTAADAADAAAASLLSSSPIKHARPPSLAGTSETTQPLMKRSRPGGDNAVETSSYNNNQNLTTNSNGDGSTAGAATTVAAAAGADGDGGRWGDGTAVPRPYSPPERPASAASCCTTPAACAIAPAAAAVADQLEVGDAGGGRWSGGRCGSWPPASMAAAPPPALQQLLQQQPYGSACVVAAEDEVEEELRNGRELGRVGSLSNNYSNNRSSQDVSGFLPLATAPPLLRRYGSADCGGGGGGGGFRGPVSAAPLPAALDLSLATQPPPPPPQGHGWVVETRGPEPMTVETTGAGTAIPQPAATAAAGAVSGLVGLVDLGSLDPAALSWSGADRRLLQHQRVWWWLGPGQVQSGRITAIDRRSEPLLFTVRLDGDVYGNGGSSSSANDVMATADCLLPYLSHGDRLMCRLPPCAASGPLEPLAATLPQQQHEQQQGQQHQQVLGSDAAAAGFGSTVGPAAGVAAASSAAFSTGMGSRGALEEGGAGGGALLGGGSTGGAAAAASGQGSGCSGVMGPCSWMCGTLQHCVFDGAVPMVHVLLGPDAVPYTAPYEFVVPVQDVAEGSGCTTAGAAAGLALYGPQQLQPVLGLGSGLGPGRVGGGYMHGGSNTCTDMVPIGLAA